MALAELLKVNQQWGTYVWSTGFTPSRRMHQSKPYISKMDLEVIINRLMNEERWEEAEKLLDLY